MAARRPSRNDRAVLDATHAWRGVARLPELVVHSDWSMHPRGRRTAIAALQRGGTYLASATQAAPEPRETFHALRAAARGGTVLAGFDFAIGLPATYAARAGVRAFTDVLPQLGSGEWRDFFSVARRPEDVSPYRPFFPHHAPTKGSATHAHLCAGLGSGSIDELRRRCDRAAGAEVMFWTLGPKQVGKGVIAGWRDLLQPAKSALGSDLLVWPFDGSFGELVARGRCVAVETYPAEMCRHLALPTVSKRMQASRRAASGALVAWAEAAHVRLTPELRAQIVDGFGARADGENDFDAVVGLFGILNVVLGRRAPGDPTDEAALAVEGSILGLQ